MAELLHSLPHSLRTASRDESVGSVVRGGDQCASISAAKNAASGVISPEESDRGDALDLIEAVRNCSTVDAMDWARSWLGWAPREIPQKSQSPARSQSPQAGPPDKVELIVRKGSDIKMESVTWLWDQRIAIGKLSLLAGEPGLGKSQVTLSLAGTVSKGGMLPSTGTAPQGRVLILSAEDTPEDTIIPRLKAVRANLDYISIISTVRETRDGICALRSFDCSLICLCWKKRSPSWAT